MSSAYNGEMPTDLIEKALKFVMQGVATNMDRYKRTASGNSIRKMRIVLESPEHGYLTGPKYPFVVLEKGRGKGRNEWRRRGQSNGGKGGFIDNIKKWIIDKGIPIHTNTSNGYNPNDFDKQATRMAGAIAYNINKYGTRLHKNGQFDDIFTTNINVATARLSTELMNWTSVKIDRILQK